MLIIFLLLISISSSLKCGEFDTDTLNITTYYIANTKRFDVGLVCISTYDYDLKISTIISCDRYNNDKIKINDKIISIIRLTFYTFLMSETAIYYYDGIENPIKILSLKNGSNMQFFAKEKDGTWYYNIYYTDSGKIFELDDVKYIN